MTTDAGLYSGLPSRNDSQIPHYNFVGFPVQQDKRIVELQQVAGRQFEPVFIGLVRRTAWVIHEWRACLLDVRAQNVRHRKVAGEIDEPLVAGDESWKIRDGQTACCGLIATGRVTLAGRGQVFRFPSGSLAM